mmetsp:Transcript_21808/g.18773  ORF Transcript_21808/g.18773 Transcript_21808/m.18773 type:complete len:114 (-) Transcript_21808:232-573(-)
MSLRVSKGVNLPSMPWLYSQILLQPAKTNYEIISDIFVIGAGFVIGCPATVYEFNVSLFYGSFEGCSVRFINLIPPHLEKANLCYDVTSVAGVFFAQGSKDISKNASYTATFL